MKGGGGMQIFWRIKLTGNGISFKGILTFRWASFVLLAPLLYWVTMTVLGLRSDFRVAMNKKAFGIKGVGVCWLPQYSFGDTSLPKM